MQRATLASAYLPADQSAVRSLVGAVGRAACTTRLDEIVQDMVQQITSDIDMMGSDRRLIDLFTASAEQGVVGIMCGLERDAPIDMDNFAATPYEYVRVLARRGVQVTQLDRCYRLAQDSLVRWCLGELARLTSDAALLASATMATMRSLSTRFDTATQHLLAMYEAERETWLLNRNASRSARIREIVDGRSIDVAAAECALGYRLDQYHLGMIVWTDRPLSADDELGHLERAVIYLGEQLGAAARPLFEPCDEHTAWAWLPLGESGRVDHARLTSVAAGWDRPVTVALGAPSPGVGGFRRSHLQAAQARVVAQVSPALGPRVVPIREVGAIALMCSDLDAARTWVADVLGTLARDDPATADLRETVRVFLSTGGSYTASAAALNMHKNTVMYRLHKVEGQLGRTVRVAKLELENALALCHWLGDAVLSANPHDPRNVN